MKIMDKRKVSDGIKLYSLQDIERMENEREYEPLRAMIISKLNDPFLREKLLRTIEGDFNRAKIISTFDDQTIEKYIDTITAEDALADILSGENISDQLREQYLPRIKDNLYKASVIANSNSDIFKQKYIGELDYANQIRVIMALEDDEIKQDYLEEIMKEEDRIEIIASIHSDDIKEQYIRNMDLDSDVAYILSTFQSDGWKEYYLMTIGSEEDRVAVIKSFSSDEIKLKYLSEINSQEHIAEIISALSDDEKKIKLADTIEDIYLKTMIIATIRDNDLKINFLDELSEKDFKDKSIKPRLAQVIEGLETYKDKKKYSSLMGPEVEARVMATITGEEPDFPIENTENFEDILKDYTYKNRDGSDFEDLSMEELGIEMKAIEARISSANEKMKETLIEKIMLLQKIFDEKNKELGRMRETLEFGGKDER